MDEEKRIRVKRDRKIAARFSRRGVTGLTCEPKSEVGR